MNNSKTRLRESDLVPIADRMRLMQAYRLIAAAIAALVAWHLPGSLAVPADTFAAATVAFVLMGFVGMLAWRRSRRAGLAAFGIVVLLDGVYLGWASYATGGFNSPIRYLIILHVIAVALLASYRTGVKVALWHSLLLLVVFYLRQGNVLRPFARGEFTLGTPFEALVGFSIMLWITAIATAHFSAMNERELRRRRYDIEALAAMAEKLELTTSSREVSEVLLECAADTFEIDRCAIFAAADGHGDLRLLASRGTAGDASAVLVAEPNSIVTEVMTSKRTHLTSRFDAHSATLATFLPDACNIVVVPLTAEAHAIGVLIVERTLRGTRVERRVVTMLERFGAYGSLALRNAWLLEHVQLLASIDTLTGLANRSTLQSGLARELARATRQHTPLSVLMLDVDCFKNVNDIHGHQIGDQVLQRMARRLSEVCRAADLAGRYGGEEFMLVLPDTTVSAAYAAGERLRRAIADDEKDPPVTVTVSIGVASYPDDARDIDGLVRAADRALYTSKSTGRNCVTRASDLSAPSRRF